jgi:hypothetical protein
MVQCEQVGEEREASLQALVQPSQKGDGFGGVERIHGARQPLAVSSNKGKYPMTQHFGRYHRRPRLRHLGGPLCYRNALQRKTKL